LRFLFVSSLIVAAAVCAAVTYTVISNLEKEVGKETYRSIASSALQGAHAITLRKAQGYEVMATVLLYVLLGASAWVDGYIYIAGKVAKLSSSTSQALIIIVDPLQATEFENHTKQVYVEQEHPQGAGASDFGFGIWKNYKVSADSPYPTAVSVTQLVKSFGGENAPY
jgi:hypothetical protein